MAMIYGTVEISINETSYPINEEVKGRMEFQSDIIEGQYPYEVFAQIICNQNVSFLENNKIKYKIVNENYVVKEVHVGTQSKIQGFYTDFSLKTNEISPSLYYKQGQVECLIQYFVNVVFRQQRTQKEIPITCNRKEIKLTTQYQEDNVVQRDIITSYGFCGLWKRPIFFLMEARRSQQNVELKLQIDQKYSLIKLSQIKVCFFQEFILNSRIKATTRRELNSKKIQLENDTQREEMSFDIGKPQSQTLTKNFALQYYLSIVCQFNQCNGAPDQEIIIPIKIFNSDQVETIQNIPQQKQANKFNKISSVLNAEMPIQLEKNIVEWQNNKIREYNEKTIIQ